MTGDAPSCAADETILAAPAEPAPGHDASAPAGHPAATAFHPGAAHRSPGSTRLQLHAGAGRKTTLPEPASARRAEVVPADIPRELPVDSVWEDIYDSAPVNNTASYGELDGTDLVAHRAQTESLRDRLCWQVSLMRLSDTDPGHRGRTHRCRRRRRLSRPLPRRHPARSRFPASGSDPRGKSRRCSGRFRTSIRPESQRAA